MTGNISILIVDDDKAHRTMLSTVLSGWGYAVTEADDGDVAVEAVRERPYDLILMDIKMIKLSGLEALEAVKTVNPAIPVVLMTAYSSVETAVDALRKGAYDYLTKPFDFDELRLALQRATEHRRLKEDNRLLREALGVQFDRRNIIGSSPVMTDLMETVAQVAPTEATVLITGESGTGKELIAGAIHFNSPRKDGPFVKVNCAAVTETLFESELFGHEKGAFTGALKRKEGRFQQAHNGTLFLDEISEISPAMQVKLLRAVQEREFNLVGGEDVVRVDVRVVAATNRNLEQEIESGAFREDLYYRLNVISLHAPPLRERKDDIPLLARHFLNRFAERNGKMVMGLTPAAMDRLTRYEWPGNVRELVNAMERAVVLSRHEYIDVAELPLALRGDSDDEPAASPDPVLSGNVSLDELEKTAILKTLEATEGNKSEAARRLGITRKTLHNKLKQYGISG